ncbi:MAG: hypothetical protein ACPGSB_09470 [Opitutales bacterium]
MANNISLFKMLRILKGILHWLLTWVYFVALICFIGAAFGVLSHVLIGPFFVEEVDLSYLAAFGFLNGLQYGGVWAGGFSIVLCVMRARKEYLAKHPGEGSLG